MYSSFNTGITNNLGVASCNLNYHSNGSVTASYSNISATASIVSNYVQEYTGALSSTLTSNTITTPPVDSSVGGTPLYVYGFLVSDLIDSGYLTSPVTTISLNQLTITEEQIYELMYEWGIFPGLTIYQEAYESRTVDVLEEFDDNLYCFLAYTEESFEEVCVIHHATTSTSMHTEVTTETITD